MFGCDSVQNWVRRNPASKSDFFSNVNEKHEAEKVDYRLFFSGLKVLSVDLTFPLWNSLYLIDKISRGQELIGKIILKFLWSLKNVVCGDYDEHYETDVEVSWLFEVVDDEGGD